MGGSVGIQSLHTPLCRGPQSPYDKEFGAFFVDSALMEGEIALRNDPTVRRAFVEYIKGGNWMEKLTKFENSVLGCENDDDTPTWTKFGYECPAGCGRARSGSVSSNSTQITETCRHPAVSRADAVARTTIQECYSALDGWTLFLEKEELRGVLIAAIYPLYIQSIEYKQLRNPGLWRPVGAYSYGEGTSVSRSTQFFSPRMARPAKKSERLRELMTGMAALFDSSELEDFLADPSESWIEDYKAAVTNLPLNIMICRVNREHHKQPEARVVYSNIKRANNDPLSALERREQAMTPGSALGRGVRKLFVLKKADNSDKSDSEHPSDRTEGCSSGDSADGSRCRSHSQECRDSPKVRHCPNPRDSPNAKVKGSPNMKGSPTCVREFSRPSSMRDFSDKVGMNLVELHAAEAPQENGKLVERAILNARFFKQRFVHNNGDFHLRALKPVFTAQGKYYCTLSVDAYGGVEQPSQGTPADLLYPPDTRFREVEDVLALLPLFIKTP
jgi:hypothetical protein